MVRVGRCKGLRGKRRENGDDAEGTEETEREWSSHFLTGLTGLTGFRSPEIGVRGGEFPVDPSAAEEKGEDSQIGKTALHGGGCHRGWRV